MTESAIEDAENILREEALMELVYIYRTDMHMRDLDWKAKEVNRTEAAEASGDALPANAIAAFMGPLIMEGLAALSD